MDVSRSKRTAQNMIMGFTYQLSVMVLSFVSRSVFIWTFGKEYLGMNGIFSDVLSLLSMADLGFSTAMAYSFYKPLAEKNEGKIAALIAFYNKIYNVIACVVLFAGLCCTPFLRFIINTDKEIPHLEIYYFISLISVVASYLFVYKTTLLTADQKDYKVVKIRMVFNFLKTILQIVSLLILKNYIVYLAIGAFIAISNNFVASRKAEKEYPFIKNNRSSEKVDTDIKSSIVENMKSVFIYKVSTTMFSATDNLLISKIISTAAVGMYSNYLMLSQKLLLIEQIIFSSMTASIGNVIAKEKPEKRYKVFQSIQSLSFILCGIITTVFCVMVNDVIHLWLGDSFQFPYLVVVAITVNTYFSCVLQPLWLYRDASGLYKKTKYIMLFAAIENIVLSIVLGKIIGVAGIIFASAIARLSTYFWYEPKLLFKEYFDKSAMKYYVMVFANISLVTVVTVFIKYLSQFYRVENVFELLVKGVATGVFSTVVFLGAYFKTEGAQNIIIKAKSIFEKRFA